MQTLWPGTQVTIGPVIENGFYYDFFRNEPFTPEDLPVIEKKMREIIARDKPFTREVWSRDEAKQVFRDKGELFKVELVDAIPEDQQIKIYKQGDWFDLCRGPHMTSTGKIGNAFKLMKVAGAYWRGDSNREMLSRIYGTAFAKQEDLDQYLKQIEEAEKRDHRKLGREMDLFHFQEEAPGSVFWHPKGWTLFQQLEAYIRRRQGESGYVEVNSPQLMDTELWVTTGHMQAYRDMMFLTEHAQRRRARLRDQADELPGARSDLQERAQVLPRSAAEDCGIRQGAPLRAVRRAARADARARVHPGRRACVHHRGADRRGVAEDQRPDPLASTRISASRDVRIKFSDRPDKRIGDDAVWDKAEAALMAALEASKRPWTLEQGRRRLLRAEARICAARRHRPRLAVRHRAGRSQSSGPARRLLHRRALEQGGAGDAPPRDVRLARALHRRDDRALCRAPAAVAVAGAGGGRDHHLGRRRLRDATRSLAAQRAGLRVESDLRNEKINYKVREHSLAKVPVLLVVGRKEAAERTVSIRRLGKEGPAGDAARRRAGDARRRGGAAGREALRMAA